MKNEFTTAMQEKFLCMMLTDYTLYARISNIYNYQNFDDQLRPAARFIKEYSEKYNAIPSPNIVETTTGVKVSKSDDVTEHSISWFFDTFEQFTRRKELERAIMKSVDLLEKGEFNPVEKLVKDAVQISLTKDLGTDYFADPMRRLMAIKNNNGQVSTGWKALDEKLYGGFNRGELNIFAGNSGSGKSLFMQNLAVNWNQVGLNGLYLSLELSEELCSKRIDSMVTGIAQQRIYKDIDDVVIKLKMISKKSGKLRIKYMPAQSNINDIRAYVKTLHIETGIKLDFICVDYLDLLMPVGAKVNPSDQFIKDKYVSEELRNLSKELDVVLVTASQLNRGAVDEPEFDHSHISGGISKINTADNVMGIKTTKAMRERGLYQLQFMKTRSSNAVNQSIDLSFDDESLRILDDENFVANVPRSNHTSDVINQIKTRSNVISIDSNGVVESSDTTSAKLAIKGTQPTALKKLLNTF